MERIIFVLQKISDGGAERVASILCNELAKKNYEVYLYVYFPTKNEYYISNKVKKIYMFDKKEDYLKISLVTKIKKIRKFLKKIKPDFIIPFLYFVGIHTAFANMFLKYKIIQTVRNDPSSIPSSKKIRFLRNFIYSFSWKIFVQNQRQKDYFSKKMRKKIVIIPNPVLDEMFNYNPNIINSNEIISVGRLNEQKNFDMLIELCKKMVEKGFDFSMKIYGEGEQRKHLENLIIEKGVANYCFLMGKSSKIGDELVKARMFIMTSKFEGMPNALMEAMAIGLPCISTNCPTGPSELISDGSDGFLVGVNDLNNLFIKTELLFTNNQLCIEFGKKAKEKMLNNYSISVIIDKFIANVLK